MQRFLFTLFVLILRKTVHSYEFSVAITFEQWNKNDVNSRLCLNPEIKTPQNF